jgi:uncharacterized iron-regulated membrane protein
MVGIKTALKIRKTHRYLGIFIGIQFLMWTISGMYFSWTDIDEIHGDQFKKEQPKRTSFKNLLGTNQLKREQPIQTLELLEIADKPYYWINDTTLFNASTGDKKNGITKDEAKQVATRYMLSDLKISSIELIDDVGDQHEYRGRPLPAYEISYETPQI